MESSVCERVFSELLCCGSDTSRHRERSVPDIWRRGAGKRWHWGVMKKCLCVRGLKNSPFRVVCLLAEQRQGSVSEICCKDYLVCILYQGTANRIFFCARLWPSPIFLERTHPFSAFLLWAQDPLWPPFSSPFIFSSKPLWKQLSLSKNCRIVVSVSCTSREPNPANLNVLCDLRCLTKLLRQGQQSTSSLHFLSSIQL